MPVSYHVLVELGRLGKDLKWVHSETFAPRPFELKLTVLAGRRSCEVMRDIFSDIDPVVVVDKIRLQTKTSPLALMFDRVIGLGDYLEIEILATDESGLVEAERQIMAKALDIGLTEKDIEPKKYDQLLASDSR